MKRVWYQLRKKATGEFLRSHDGFWNDGHDEGHWSLRVRTTWDLDAWEDPGPFIVDTIQEAEKYRQYNPDGGDDPDNPRQAIPTEELEIVKCTYTEEVVRADAEATG